MSASVTTATILSISLLAFAFYHITTHITYYENLGMDMILSIQPVRSRPLDFVMRIASVFGFEFFFFLVPMLAWWGDRKYLIISLNLFKLLCGALFMIGLAKLTFQRSRPWRLNDAILQPVHDSGAMLEFSYPSGHAWAATSFFFLAFQLQRPLFWALALVLALTTSFSRIYFGVHYPHDIAGGFICGMTFVFAFIFIQSTIHAVSEKKQWDNTRVSNIVAAVALCAMGVVNFFVDPAHRIVQPGIVFVPFCLFGVVACRPYMPDLQCTSRKKRALRVLLGTPVIFALFPLYSISGPVMRAVVAAFIGVWVFALAPVVFNRFGLVGKRETISAVDETQNKPTKKQN